MKYGTGCPQHNNPAVTDGADAAQQLQWSPRSVAQRRGVAPGCRRRVWDELPVVVMLPHNHGATT